MLDIVKVVMEVSKGLSLVKITSGAGYKGKVCQYNSPWNDRFAVTEKYLLPG
jgi:hypothetical protein